MSVLNYVELPVSDIAASRAFFEEAFGWELKPFGPSYAATTTGLTDLGLQGDRMAQSRAPLPVIEVDDLQAALAAVQKAGRETSRPAI